MNELRILVSAVLLAAGVSAVVAAATVRLGVEDPPRIASVRLAELTAAYAAVAARDGNSAEATARAVRKWARALDLALAEVADRRNAVLLPARAIAGGAPDVTAEVEDALERALAAMDRPGPSAATEPRP